MVDHRMDEELFEQNQEKIGLNENIDAITFKRVRNITRQHYSGEVYDLKIENQKNYNTKLGLSHNGGRRKGAACVYLETHHPDIMSFLELRDNTGDHEKRAYNLNLANWIPDLFMKRVENDEMWSLIDPDDAPELTDLFGEEYEARYLELEAEGKTKGQLSARKIYRRMLQTLAETGNGWMTFKDASNERCNSAVDGHVVHSSNLCTEIIEPTYCGDYNKHSSEEFVDGLPNATVVNYDVENKQFDTIDNAEVAVCNLGSINLSKYVKNNKLDKTKLRKNVQHAVKYLDKVIDKNFYPIHESKCSNHVWRPVGLGLMGWQDMLFQMKLPFEDPRAIELAKEISEEIYYNALKTSCELAKEYGSHENFEKTHAAQGKLQFDLAALRHGYKPKYNDDGALIDYMDNDGNSYPHQPKDHSRWNELKQEIQEHGLRNSLLIAIAPTATISAIVGAYECIEPQVSNVFKRETLSGEFITVNSRLVNDLKEIGLWNEDIRRKLIAADGSIQDIDEIPASLKELYKTVWEVKQRSIIDTATARSAFVDQAQSTNLFMANPTIDKLSSMYMYAWKNGLKTTYYLRSKPATRIMGIGDNQRNSSEQKNNTQGQNSDNNKNPDLENPEICESCT